MQEPKQLPAAIPLLLSIHQQSQPRAPSLNFVYRKNQQLDAIPSLINKISQLRHLSEFLCQPVVCSYHQQFLFSSNQSTQIRELAGRAASRAPFLLSNSSFPPNALSLLHRGYHQVEVLISISYQAHICCHA
jgi:hypothetical protein